jgi:3-oxoacyl-[acyl-carrier-protein] synthase-3
MSEIYIDHLAYALGSIKSSVTETHAKGLTFSEAAALANAGFEFHHRCGDSETPLTLAREAVSKTSQSMDKKGQSLKSVDAILHSTCVIPSANLGDVEKFKLDKDVKHLMDFPASHLQNEFAMNQAFVVGVNQQACTGVIGTLRLANALLKAEPHLNSILCVTADRFPAGAKYEQSYNLISDGAASCIVSRQPSGYRLLSSFHLTNGAMAQASDDETVGFYFNYSHKVIMGALAQAKLNISDIGWVVPQNTSDKAWRILAKLMKFDFEKVLFPTLKTVGHCISGDNIINLVELANDSRIKPGDKIILMMAGFGLNWQAAVIEKV